MRKDVSYFCTKLEKLHKSNGLRFLKEEYSEKPKNNRYKGYHCFKDRGEVKMRYDEGKPLSCFVLDGNFDQVHVAYNTNFRSSTRGNITYTTFKYKTSDLHKKEAGVHFCRFALQDEDSTKSVDTLNITHYALMLPYLHPSTNGAFEKQFTLVYSDWDVLRCDLPEKKKGKVSTRNNLFNNISDL